MICRRIKNSSSSSSSSSSFYLFFFSFFFFFKKEYIQCNPDTKSLNKLKILKTTPKCSREKEGFPLHKEEGGGGWGESDQELKICIKIWILKLFLHSFLILS